MPGALAPCAIRPTPWRSTPRAKPHRARKHAAVQLDLCGIAKGYAVDRMVAVLQQHSVRHALVALDGELRAVGNQASGVPWSVALESPEAGRRAVHGVIDLQDLAVATSGDYRRYLEVGDARLAHTMDGRRAAPVNNAVASVTVLAHTCMQADAWASVVSTAPPRRAGGDGAGTVRRIYRAVSCCVNGSSTSRSSAIHLVRSRLCIQSLLTGFTCKGHHHETDHICCRNRRTDRDHGMQVVANNAAPDAPGYGWRYFSDPVARRAVVISPQGDYYYSRGKGLHWIAAEQSAS